MADLLIVGLTPGRPRPGLPRERSRFFRVLDAWLQQAGLPPGSACEAPFVNLVPVDLRGRAPTRKEVEGWAPDLDQVIKDLKPRVVLALGRTVTDALGCREHDFHRDAGETYAALRRLGKYGLVAHVFWIMPLPHPSGRNRLLNGVAGDEIIARSMTALRKELE